ncbi:unnamed protein product [Orchesella dallaii]|uniref:SCP domain-containing protein n=1 Tax=Orchesella dallaii TaxID=48710 RepID=A0ABP1QWK1_9HEXA
MARLALVALCVTTVIVSSSAMSPMDFGMTMSVRAYDLVCWYEKLKQFPNTDSDGYTMQCFGQAEGVKKQITDDDMAKQYFGDWMIQLAMSGLPEEYGSTCDAYLMDADKAPAVDESDALNDGQEGSTYPFQGFSYCLLTKLRKKFGEKAIQAVKDEKTHQKKHWMSTLLDRDNEFRARHGSPPFKLIRELNDAAQAWADKNARECNMYHSDNDDPGRQWRGDGTGESLSAAPTVPKEDAAYIASDGWYEENKDYPFSSGGYNGDGNDALFKKIGHFTQSVWSQTKYSGYGLAINPECGDQQIFIAGRYSPAGNMQGAYQKNVLPARS